MSPPGLDLSRALVVCMAIILPLPSHGAPRVKRSEDDLLLVEVLLDQVSLSTAVPIYPHPGGGALLPLGELCRLLSIGIRVSIETGTAEGFVIQENRSFGLSIAGGTVAMGLRQSHFDPRLVEWHDDDIYVHNSLLSKWLPIDVETDFTGAILRMKAREVLPIQEKLARKKNLGISGFRLEERPPNAVPIEVPYRLMDVPVIDQALVLSWDPKDTRRLSGSGSTYLAGDLLFMSHRLYMTEDTTKGLGNFRQTFSREDPEGQLLGPLKARIVEVGSVFTPSRELLGSSRMGRGLALGNYPTSFRTKFDAKSFRGNLPDGWSVELFIEKILVGYQLAKTDGLYEFLDIPLRFGLNEIRLVFHGPVGQRREEVHRLDVSASQLPKGALYYQAFAIENEEGGHSIFMGADYGLGKSLSLNAGVFRAREDALQATTAQIGFQGFLPFLSFQGGFAGQRSGGRAAYGVLNTGWGFSTLTVRHTETREFQGRDFSSTGRQVLSRTGVNLQGSWTLNGWMPFQVGLSDQRDRFKGGGLSTQSRFSVGVSIMGWSIANALEWRNAKGLSVAAESSRAGNLSVALSANQLNFRGEVSYRLSDATRRSRLERITTSAEFKSSARGAYQAGITREVASHNTAIFASFGRMEGKMGLSLRAQYSSLDRLSATLRLSISLVREPRTGAWATNAMSMADGGAVSAVAFLDGNGNGLQEPGEPLLEGVAFNQNGAKRPPLKEKKGVSLVGPLFRGNEAYLSVDTSSLEDPYMKPRTDVLAVLPRPGKVPQLSFALVVLGEVTGTVFLSDNGKRKEYPGISVELVNDQGMVVKSLASAYDGFFDFTEVPPGDYILRVSPADILRLHLIPPTPKPLKITPTSNVFDGVDLIIERAHPLAPPSALLAPPPGILPPQRPQRNQAPEPAQPETAQPEPSPRSRP